MSNNLTQVSVLVRITKGGVLENKEFSVEDTPTAAAWFGWEQYFFYHGRNKLFATQRRPFSIGLEHAADDTGQKIKQ